MKIRVIGTLEELNVARDYYLDYARDPSVKCVTVSQYYPNRGSRNVYRLYVDIEIHASAYENKLLARKSL